MRVMCHDNEEWCKIWLVSSKSIWGIWRILTGALKNPQNLHFKRMLLTKVCNVWANKVQRSYVWWYGRLIQNLKENFLMVSKMTWRIWQIFTGWKCASRCSMETLFYLGSKWIAKLTKRFTHVLKNRCS